MNALLCFPGVLVLMVHGNGCPIVRNTVPVPQAIRDRYRSQGVLKSGRHSAARAAH
jgi:hypothetical protein